MYDIQICDKNVIYMNYFVKKEYSYIDYIKAGIGLPIYNRYAHWFFYNNAFIKCKINKKQYNKCIMGEVTHCINFMELLKKCNYKI